jgi:hypothetical protein
VAAVVALATGQRDEISQESQVSQTYQVAVWRPSQMASTFVQLPFV